MPDMDDSIPANRIGWLTIRLNKITQLIQDNRRSQKLFTALQRAIRAFLSNQYFQVIINNPSVITIERYESFKPQDLLGEGWRIVWQDDRSLAITELDLSNVVFDSFVGSKEPWIYIRGYARSKRLEEASCNYIPLDAEIFQTLWENPYLIPDSWKSMDGKDDENGRTIYIFFNGTILQDENGAKCILALCWNQNKGWFFRTRYINDIWCSYHLSALLPLPTDDSEIPAPL